MMKKFLFAAAFALPLFAAAQRITVSQNCQEKKVTHLTINKLKRGGSTAIEKRIEFAAYCKGVTYRIEAGVYEFAQPVPNGYTVVIVEGEKPKKFVAGETPFFAPFEGDDVTIFYSKEFKVTPKCGCDAEK